LSAFVFYLSVYLLPT